MLRNIFSISNSIEELEMMCGYGSNVNIFESVNLKCKFKNEFFPVDKSVISTTKFITDCNTLRNYLA